MKARQQLVAVQLERGGQKPALHGAIEGLDVAPQRVARQRQLFVAPRRDDGAELAAQRVERTPQAGTSVGLIELRPQQTNYAIAANKVPGPLHREIRQQRDELGLREHARRIAVSWRTPVQLRAAEQRERRRVSRSLEGAR